MASSLVATRRALIGGICVASLMLTVPAAARLQQDSVAQRGPIPVNLQIHLDQQPSDAAMPALISGLTASLADSFEGAPLMVWVQVMVVSFGHHRERAL
jgi:hypothetical protein